MVTGGCGLRERERDDGDQVRELEFQKRVELTAPFRKSSSPPEKKSRVGESRSSGFFAAPSPKMASSSCSQLKEEEKKPIEVHCSASCKKKKN